MQRKLLSMHDLWEHEWVFVVTIQPYDIDFPALPGDFSLNLSHHMEVTIMTENILETIRKGVQDFVAPEVRQIKADLGGLGAKFDGLRAEFDAFRSEVRANQQALMAALENAVLRGEMGTQREISELRERVTRIEDQLRTPRQ